MEEETGLAARVVALHAKDVGKADKDLDGVPVDAESLIDGVVHGIRRNILGTLDNLLCVIEHKSTEDSKASVHDNVHKHSRLGEEHGTETRSNNNSEANRERASHPHE